MKVEQIYTGCLSHAAYYIENNGEAAIVDPLREVDPYIARAKKDNAKIKYVFETHFHADFVSGHLDLAAKTGAKIVYGPNAKPNFDAVIAHDNQEFKVGNYTIRVIHTPGHTMESTTYLLIDENRNEHGLITGDTLFIGDVGRPDLGQHVVAELTPELLAGHLYDSLRNKIMPLSDKLIVYPNHGAGSSCGKNMSKETTDTLGHQKKVNYALDPALTKESFTKIILEGLVSPPSYFPQNVRMNIEGYKSIDKVVEEGTKMLSVTEFERVANESNALIIDTRDPDLFTLAFIPGSINFGLNGNFATWVGTLIPNLKQPLLIVSEKGKETEVITRLARVGYENSNGFLKGGFDSWIEAGKQTDSIVSITADDFPQHEMNLNTQLLDVRKASEFESEHIVNAINVPLDFIDQHVKELDPKKISYVYCAGGYRSVIFISLLRTRGYRNFINIKGGFKALKETGKVALSEFICQTSML